MLNPASVQSAVSRWEPKIRVSVSVSEQMWNMVPSAPEIRQRIMVRMSWRHTEVEFWYKMSTLIMLLCWTHGFWGGYDFSWGVCLFVCWRDDAKDDGAFLTFDLWPPKLNRVILKSKWTVVCKEIPTTCSRDVAFAKQTHISEQVTTLHIYFTGRLQRRGGIKWSSRLKLIKTNLQRHHLRCFNPRPVINITFNISVTKY